MAKAKEHFLPLYFGDFLASTGEWPGEARSLYLTALAHQWVNPMRSLPADLDALRSLIGWSETTFDRWWPRVADKFEVHADRLANARLEEHRARNRELTQRRSEAGRKGAAVTNKKPAMPETPTGKTSAKPNGTVGIADSSAPALPTKNPGEAAKFAASSEPNRTEPISEQERASGSVTESGSATPANEDQDRARTGAKKATGRELDPRAKALTLLAAGNKPGDIARMLGQYGVTADQVRAWQREEATRAGS